MRILFPTLLALLASPAFAAPLTRDMPAEIDAYKWREPVIIDDYLFDAIGTDAQSFHFEGAMLADVQDALGGTLQENYDHRWLCYEAPGLRINFVGDWLEFDAPSPLELVTIERVDEGNPDCLAKPELAGLVAKDLPGIGASANDLLTRFGKAEILAEGRLGYRSVKVLGDEESWTVVKTVYYRQSNGVIDQMALRWERRDNPHFGGWAEGRYATSAEDAVYAESTAPLFGEFELSGKPARLEVDTVPDVLARFGQEKLQQGEAGGHVVWGCMIKDGTRVWFTSDGEMGGQENRLMGVTFDRSDAFDFSFGCIAAPAEFTLPVFDAVPMIGASLDELKQRFGSVDEDSHGQVHYIANVPLNDGTPMAAYQSIDYRIENGKVSAVALNQETGD